MIGRAAPIVRRAVATVGVGLGSAGLALPILPGRGGLTMCGGLVVAGFASFVVVFLIESSTEDRMAARAAGGLAVRRWLSLLAVVALAFSAVHGVRLATGSAGAGEVVLAAGTLIAAVALRVAIRSTHPAPGIDYV